MTEIKFCDNNFVHGTGELVDKLKEAYDENEVSVVVESCLGFCGDCAEGPYALVNDELIKADTAEDLLEAITEIID